MDGNRRWARGRGLLTFEGHRRGYEKMKDVADWCLARNIKIMTFFAFSTENWKRSKKEVGYLMGLLHRALSADLAEFQKRGLKLRIIGRREGLPKKLAAAIRKAEEVTAENKNGTLFIAINYGGRAEIVDAAKKAIASGVKPEELNEDIFHDFLYAPEAPDPDIIVRTSGEQRISGFLIYSGAYSELYFTECHWPDFSEKDLEKIIDWYGSRERRLGK